MLALAVAVVALLVAALSLVVAWRAVDQAGVARDIAAGRGGSADRTDAPGEASPRDEDPPPDAPGPDDPSATDEPDIPELNEQTKFAPKYTKEELRLQTTCDESVDVDLDEPRVGVSDNGEVQFGVDKCYGESGQGFFTLLRGTFGASVATATLTPNDCVQRIRTGPLAAEVKVPVRQGVVLCVITSGADARTQGVPQKIVVLEVRAVSADWLVTVQVSSWNVPR